MMGSTESRMETLMRHGRYSKGRKQPLIQGDHRDTRLKEIKKQGYAVKLAMKSRR